VVKLAEAIRLALQIKAAGPRRFSQHMMPHVVRPAQIIWNKALGAVFLLLALLFLGSGVRYYTSAPNPLGLGLAIFIGLIMGAFGINSLLRARRLSRLG
jgi:hypothetical protein